MDQPIKSDLHLHTTHSDGRLSPSELLTLCVERGLNTVAVTDHDTTSGLDECEIIASEKGLDFIPGIEFGAKAQRGEIHILGYFIDKNFPLLQAVLSDLQEDRKTRAERMVELLCQTGTSVSWDRVSELAAGGSVGRPHIAQALVEEGYASHPKDAFDRLINWKAPAYVPRKLIQPKEAVDLIKGSGGLAVLAHPLESKAKSGRLLLPRLLIMELLVLRPIMVIIPLNRSNGWFPSRINMDLFPVVAVTIMQQGTRLSRNQEILDLP